MIAAALAVLADAFTTHRALQAGLTEGNSILRRLLGARPPLWKAILWRAAIFVPLAVFVPVPAFAWWTLAVVLIFVAVRNSRLTEASY
jgi:hypothetical protein